MYDIVVLESLCFRPSTLKGKVNVFKSPLWGPLSGDLCFWCPKRPFSCGQKAKNTLIRVNGALNSCKPMRRLYGYAANEPTLYEQNSSSAWAHACTFLRRPLHDVKRPNATFCEGPRMHDDELLLLDRDAVLKIQIPEISSPFFNLQNAT